MEMQQQTYEGALQRAAVQSFWLLQVGFTAAPILFGLDKFFNWTTGLSRPCHL
jgi:hypothetical protein